MQDRNGDSHFQTVSTFAFPDMMSYFFSSVRKKLEQTKLHVTESFFSFQDLCGCSLHSAGFFESRSAQCLISRTKKKIKITLIFNSFEMGRQSHFKSWVQAQLLKSCWHESRSVSYPLLLLTHTSPCCFIYLTSSSRQQGQKYPKCQGPSPYFHPTVILASLQLFDFLSWRVWLCPAPDQGCKLSSNFGSTGALTVYSK